MKKEQKISLVLWASLLAVSPFLKFTIPLGEKGASLSCFSIILPLLFVVGSKKYSMPIFTAILAAFSLITLPITAGIPTFLAGLSWRYSKYRGKNSLFIHLLFPLLCMALFARAPLVGSGWVYALYWVIPMVCYFLPKSLLTRALQSTFVAHATGSVIWAYFLPMNGAKWLSLMPVVAVERAAAVLFSVMAILTLQKAAQLLLSMQKEFSLAKR